MINKPPKEEVVIVARPDNVVPFPAIDKGELMKAFVRAVKTESAGCTECQSPDNKLGLKFHHRNPREKVAAVGGMARQPHRFGLTDLMNEIAKCDLVCSDCHKTIHRRWRRLTGHENCNPAVK